MIDKKKVLEAITKALAESKGKRKFSQSIDLGINFKDVDFKKPESRVNVDVTLPHQPRETKVAIFADPQTATEAKKVADLVLLNEDIVAYAADKKKQKELLNYSFLAVPSLMAVVGKQLGQFLGARGRLPKPIPPNANLGALVGVTRRSVNLKNKGKYLPVLHCVVGREGMSEEDVTENVLAVIDAVTKKVPASNISNIYVKLTMGPAMKIAS